MRGELEFQCENSSLGAILGPGRVPQATMCMEGPVLEFQPDFANFACGLGFLFLASCAASSTAFRRRAGGSAWAFLAAFGALKGAAFWTDALSSAWQRPLWASILGMAFDASSLFSLFGFGLSLLVLRGVASRLLPALAVALGAAAIPLSYLGGCPSLDALRWTLGVPGAFLSVFLILFSNGAKDWPFKGWEFKAFAVFLALSGALLPFECAPGASFPWRQLNASAFHSFAFSSPAVFESLFAALCGAVLLVMDIRTRRFLEERHLRKVAWIQAAISLSLLCSLFIGWKVADILETMEVDAAKTKLLSMANSYAKTIYYGHVKALTGMHADSKAPAFKRLNAQLRAMAALNPEWRWTYLVGLRDGRMFSLVDSLPLGDPEASPSDYDEAPALMFELLRSGGSSVFGPYKDRWGSWISALSPVFDDVNGRPIALFGIDIEAARWQAMSYRARFLGIVSAQVLSLLLLIGMLLASFEASRSSSAAFSLRLLHLETAYIGIFCLAISALAFFAMEKETDFDLKLDFQRLTAKRADVCANMLNDLRLNIYTIVSFIRSVGSADSKALLSFSPPLSGRLGEGNAMAWASGSPPRIRWLDPLKGNESLFGLDLSEDPLCARAISESANSQLRSIAGPFQGAGGTSYRIFQPMYSFEGGLSPSPASPAQEPAGYVVGIWSPAHFLHCYRFQNLEEDDPLVKMRLIDVSSKQPVSIASFPEQSSSDLLDGPAFAGFPRLDMAFSVFGRDLVLRCASSRDYFVANSSWMPLLVLLSGLLISGAICLLTFLLQSGRVRAEGLVRERTAELLGSEARFAQVAELSREMIWELDPEGVFTYASVGSKSILGLSPEELVGRRKLFEFTAGTGVDKALQLFLARSPLANCSCELFKSDGSHLWTSRNAVPLHGPDGSFMGYRGSDYDISKSKEAERVSEVQTKFLQTLIDSIPNPLVYKDASCRYIGCNKAFEKHSGLPREQILGKTVFELKSLGVTEHYVAIERELLMNGGSKSFEASMRVGDGSVRDFLVSKAAFLNPDSTIGGIIGVLVDISDRKRVESERLRNEAHLEGLLRLSQFQSKSLEDLLDFALEQALRLSSSSLGFLFVRNESKGCLTLNSLLSFDGSLFSVPPRSSSEDPWVQDAIFKASSEGRAILANAVPGEPRRFLAVPLGGGGGAQKAVLLVASKPCDYESSDSLQLSLLMESIWKIYERNLAEEKVRQDLKSLTVILNILHMAMEDVPLKELLSMALTGLTSMPWFDFMGKGSILLYDNEAKALVSELSIEGAEASSHSGFCCESVKLGSCICGQVAESKSPVFARFDDKAHSAHCGAAGPHAHYCIPILYGQQLVGVLNMLVNADHQRQRAEENFLQAVAGVLAVVIQRRRADEDLMEAHDANQTILSSIPSMMISLDRSRRVVQMNLTAQRTLAVKEQAVVGKPFADCGIKWDWDILSARLGAIERGEQASALDEISFTKPDGQEGYLRVSITPVRESVRGAGEILLIAEDVTDRRSLETQLLQAQKLEAIGQLAAGIAHEINTPTQYIGDNLLFLQDSFKAVVSFMARLPLDSGQGLSPELAASLKAASAELDMDFVKEEAPKALQQSIEGVARISEIVHAMKEFSHPGVKGKAPVDLNKAVMNTITVARNEWKYVSDVKTELSPSLPLVPCAPGEINQVFLNVIVNAAHAIGDVVGKSGSKGLIHISTALSGNMAEVRFKDTGTGIPESIKDRIFEPFFTTKGVGKGTGQGLSIARNIIVNKHGGEFFFETEPGKGTTFVVRLPVEDPKLAKEDSQA